MKFKTWPIILLSSIFLVSGCMQKQEISEGKISTINETKIELIKNQTEVAEDETTLLPDCEPNQPYLNKDECKCEYSWKRYLREHGHCTPIKNTYYSCIKGIEIEVHFKSTSTFEEAEIIVNKYDGKVMQFTCWFERRDDPYITTIVKEENEQEFINQIKCKYSIQSLTGGWKATTCIRNICILRNPTERALASEQSPNL